MLQEIDDLEPCERDFIHAWNAVVQGAGQELSSASMAHVCRTVLRHLSLSSPPSSSLASRPQFPPPHVYMAHLLDMWEERQLCRDDLLLLAQEYHALRRELRLADAAVAIAVPTAADANVTPLSNDDGGGDKEEDLAAMENHYTTNPRLLDTEEFIQTDAGSSAKDTTATLKLTEHGQAPMPKSPHGTLH